MLILPKTLRTPKMLDPARPGLANALKTALSKNKIGLAILGYFFLLEVCFFGGYYYSLKKLSKTEPLTPFLGVIENEATMSAEVAAAETEDVAAESNSASDSTSPPNPQPQWSPLPATTHSNTFPTWGTPNNKFGMYINADPNQIAEVAPLINSNGGDWGWVLIPFPIKHRDHSFWQNTFDTCRGRRIKPVLQLYTTQFDLEYMDFPGLAEFLNGLVWPTKHLYISVLNETNAVYYWGGRKAPEEYAVALNTAIDAFKSVNPNFFILNGGFNSSCRSGPLYMDEKDYLLAMDAAVPGIFKKLDGWANHAYPQPEFSGDFYNPPSWYGVRDQIENYKWEMELLRKHFGVTGLPIFITETGWAHQEGWKPKWQYKLASLTARYFDDAYRNHWLPENQIVAIMPFVWYNSDAPNFNWKRDDGTFYPQYDVVMSFPKVAGTND